MFDDIVVGAGSAGCALAARLSEDPEVSVALVEAGPTDTVDEVHIPAAFPSLFKGPLDWDYDTEPEPGIDGRRAFLPRGKVLGGCSSINAMIYMRGNRADYDRWAADGAEGWNYEDVLPYFTRAEDNVRGADEFHGTGGPLSVDESRSMNPVVDAWVDAAVEAGLPHNEDFNGASQLGVGRFQTTQRGGMRCSAAVAYLHPAMERPNLTVITDTLTRKVLFEGERVVGIEVQRDGQVQEIRAGREVILSAGAYGSAHLLLLSGVGPAAQLEAFGIPLLGPARRDRHDGRRRVAAHRRPGRARRGGRLHDRRPQEGPDHPRWLQRLPDAGVLVGRDALADELAWLMDELPKGPTGKTCVARCGRGTPRRLPRPADERPVSDRPHEPGPPRACIHGPLLYTLSAPTPRGGPFP